MIACVFKALVQVYVCILFDISVNVYVNVCESNYVFVYADYFPPHIHKHTSRIAQFSE